MVYMLKCWMPYKAVVSVLGWDFTPMRVLMNKQKLWNKWCVNFPLSRNAANPLPEIWAKFAEQSAFPASLYLKAETEHSTVSRGIPRTSRARGANPNFISGSGIGRMWKSINIKRWSVGINISRAQETREDSFSGDPSLNATGGKCSGWSQTDSSPAR